MAVDRDKLRKAEKLVSQGKLQAAVDKYLGLLKSDPEDFTLNNAIGDLFVRLGETKQAVPHFQKAAETLEKSGFRTRAIATLRKAYRQAPSNSEIVESLAVLLKEEGLVADARQILTELARNRYQLGMYSDATNLYRRILEIDPNNLDSLVKISEIAAKEGRTDEQCEAYCTIANQLVNSARFEEALEIIEEGYNISPEHPHVIKIYCDILHRLGNTEKAATLLQKLYQMESADIDVIIALAELALDSDHLEKAHDLFNKAKAINEESERVLLLGSSLALREGDPDSALGYLAPLIDKALAEKVGGPVVAALEAIVQTKKNHLSTLKKLKSIYTYLKDKEGIIHTVTLISEAHEKSGDFRLAIDSAEELLNIEPNKLAHKNRLERLYTHSQGSAMFDDSGTSEEILDLPESLEMDENGSGELDSNINPDVKRILMEVDVFLRYGLTQKAKDRLKEALIIDKFEPRTYEKMGRVLAEENDIQQATANFKQAIDLFNQQNDSENAGRVTALMLDSKSGVAQSNEIVITEPSLSDTLPPISDVQETASLSKPAEQKKSPQSTSTDPLQSKLTEAEYYIEQNFISAAHHMLSSLKDQHPDNKNVLKLWDILQAKMKSELDVAEVEKDLDDFFSPLDESPAAMVESAADNVAEAQKPAETPEKEIEFLDHKEDVGGAIADEMGSPLKEIADILEEDIFAVHSAAEKRLGNIEETSETPRAERILSHLSSESLNQQDSADAAKHYEMALAYMETGLLEDAIRDFQIAAEDPIFFQKSCLQLGICFKSKDMSPVAIDWLQKGISGGGDMDIMADLLHQLAMIYHQMGQKGAFDHTLLQLESLAPDHPGLPTLKTIQ